MDIQRTYDDDLSISTLLTNSQSDENFGLELQLQEAMHSSFTTAPSKKRSRELCEICAETKDSDDMFPIQDCKHGYCKQCISKHVSIELQKRRKIITCPALDCTALLEIGTCGEIVAADVRRTWEEVLVAGADTAAADEDLMLQQLAKLNKWQRCPNCKFYVDKVEGCMHMTCRCRFQFCYACGEAWSSTHGGCQMSMTNVD